MSLTGDQWKKHSIVMDPEAPCILGMDYLKRGYFKDLKGYRWASGVAMVPKEKSKLLSALPGLSEDPSFVGLLVFFVSPKELKMYSRLSNSYC
ncbi:hypothetical protein BTVI_42143 [Pitangus sulphuratus]|nr:hypothetical protein BTVI_42143 [Pitangus sulphuratus]